MKKYFKYLLIALYSQLGIGIFLLISSFLGISDVKAMTLADRWMFMIKNEGVGDQKLALKLATILANDISINYDIVIIIIGIFMIANAILIYVIINKYVDA